MSFTVTIPGGTAELFDPNELTPRRRIPGKALLFRADNLLAKLAVARRVTSPDGDVDENPALPGPEYRLSQHEAEILQHLQYAATWAYLKSWTLDAPFPATWEDLLDISDDVTDVLNEAVRNIGNPDVTASMEMSDETLVDKGSFTGNSAAPKTSSGAKGKRRSSPRKPSNS
jgi:hypothetical protein